MKYLLASLIAAGLMGGVSSADMPPPEYTPTIPPEQANPVEIKKATKEAADQEAAMIENAKEELKDNGCVGNVYSVDYTQYPNGKNTYRWDTDSTGHPTDYAKYFYDECNQVAYYGISYWTGCKVADTVSQDDYYMGITDNSLITCEVYKR